MAETRIVHAARDSNEDRPSTPRTAIVVASVHHGNTRKIAEVMATTLHAKLFMPTEITADELSQFDLVGFGSGIYFGRHHKSLRRIVKSLTHESVPRFGFVFSTAGLPFLHRVFHWPVRRKLTRLGCTVVRGFCCRGWDTVGPLWLFGGINRRHPNQRDMIRAKSFAERMAHKCLLELVDNRQTN